MVYFKKMHFELQYVIFIWAKNKRQKQKTKKKKKRKERNEYTL